MIRPPAGWALDAMIVCTYSADLRSVVALPAALIANDQRLSSPAVSIGPTELALLRRICDHTMVFCQEAALLGADRLPPAVIETESMVHEVTAPGGGAFHPKVWLVRFAAEQRHFYRLAVLSRNLTADRSWDIGVIMEGKPTARLHADGLSELLAALPGQCKRPLSQEQSQRMETFVEASKRIRWQPPAGLTRPELHLSGFGKTWAPPQSDKLILFSPFLDKSAVKRLAASTKNAALVVSRTDALDRTWSVVDKSFDRTAVLSAPTDLASDLPYGALHAKTYFWEQGAQRGLAIGSMNATSPALDGRNVEFMASFNATALFPSGIAGLVEDTALGNVIIDYAPFDDSEVAAPPPDDRPARRAICALDLRLVCEPSDQEWRLTLVSGDRLDRKSVDLLKGLTYRLATMEQSQASPCLEELIATGSARFPQTVPLAMMTGYVVFEAASVGAFTLNLSVEGVALEERRQAALRSLLPDQRSFMEFMRAWLGDGAALEQAKAIDGEVNGTGWTFSGASGGLLEMLIRCAADEPARLKRIDEALSGFGDAELKRLAPESFLKLWRSLIGEHPK